MPVYAPPMDAGPAYLIPARALPALSARFGTACVGVGKTLPRKGGGVGYRSVVCGELDNPPLVLTLDRQGRLRVRVRVA